MEFQAKFEHEKGLNAGAINYGGRALQDELRIRYLQKTIESMEVCHDRDVKEIEIRLRSKMHVYV